MPDTMLPTTLRELADTRLARYAENAGDTAFGWDALPGDARRVWACSEFVAESCIRRPALLAELLESGDLERDYASLTLARLRMSRTRSQPDGDLILATCALSRIR